MKEDTGKLNPRAALLENYKNNCDPKKRNNAEAIVDGALNGEPDAVSELKAVLSKSSFVNYEVALLLGQRNQGMER